MKKLLFVLLLSSSGLYAQAGRTTSWDLPLWNALDTLHAGSTTDSSNNNSGLNNISLKTSYYLNRWFDRSRDSLRNIKRIRLANGLILDGSNASIVYWSGANLTDGPALQMYTSAGLQLAPWGVSANQTTPIRFYDQVNNKYVSFHAPQSIVANFDHILPDTAGALGYLLKSKGGSSGHDTLAWVNPSSIHVDSSRISDTSRTSSRVPHSPGYEMDNKTAADSVNFYTIDGTYTLDSVRMYTNGGTTVKGIMTRLRSGSQVDLLSTAYTMTGSWANAGTVANTGLQKGDQISAVIRSIASGTVTYCVFQLFYH